MPTNKHLKLNTFSTITPTQYALLVWGLHTKSSLWLPYGQSPHYVHHLKLPYGLYVFRYLRETRKPKPQQSKQKETPEPTTETKHELENRFSIYEIRIPAGHQFRIENSKNSGQIEEQCRSRRRIISLEVTPETPTIYEQYDTNINVQSVT
jgi:hypothetical protein